MTKKHKNENKSKFKYIGNHYEYKQTKLYS